MIQTKRRHGCPKEDNGLCTIFLKANMARSTTDSLVFSNLVEH